VCVVKWERLISVCEVRLVRDYLKSELPQREKACR
jgi:hypothetical protein